MNESKAKSPSWWDRIRAKGGVGDILDAELQNLGPKGQPIDAVAEHYAGERAGRSTLSIGRRGVSPHSYKPVAHADVPGHGFRPGQLIKNRKDLPPGSKPI